MEDATITANSARAARPTRRPTTHLLAFLALASVLPYANTLLNGFVYDDLTQVMNNPYIVNFHHLRQIFSTGVWSYIGQQGVSNYYRPMMTFGYLLGYHAFGKVAFGYHLVNVALELAVVWILFGLTLTLFRRRDVAFLAALIFALHPVHVESVAWIAAVTDLQLTLFYLLTFWLFVALVRPGGRRSTLAFAGMVICYVLALLSKEQALTLPVLAMFYEYACRSDRAASSSGQKLARYGVLWLLAGGYLLARARLLGALAPVNQMPRLTWPQTFLSAFALAGHYVEKMLWPVSLCAFYVFHKSASLLDWRVLAGLAIAAGSIALFAAMWKRERLVSFGVLWFFITLAPVLNARWMAANVFAERYLYLPSVGFCWVLGWCLAALWFAAAPARRVQRGLAAAFAVVLVLCAARIVTRNRDWNNNVRLYTRTLEQQPDAYAILNNLGAVYWAQGKAAAAQKEWLRALVLHPKNTIVLNNLGLFYAKEKDYAKAVECFERAMRLKPAYTDPHLNLGGTEEQMGDLGKAERQLRTAAALAPLSVRAQNELGELLLKEGRQTEAQKQFEAAERIDPNGEALDRLGEIYLRAGRIEDAARVYTSALGLNPIDSVAHFGLAEIDAARGRVDDARKEYEAGLRVDPRNAPARVALKKLSHANLTGSASEDIKAPAAPIYGR
ncbi:MAG: tetratricopeptide repeat protein [Terriglobia bacterium]